MQFKELTKAEEISYRKWARENYRPFNQIFTVWHPIVQEECKKMNAEQYAKDHD